MSGCIMQPDWGRQVDRLIRLHRAEMQYESQIEAQRRNIPMKGQTLARIFSVAMLLFASQEGLMSQTNQQEKVPNVVLVHGGFVDGSGWEGVYNALKKSGYAVTVVQEATASFADDVATTKQIGR